MTLIPDISHHHPVINADRFYSQCSFIITKATEGTSYVDTTLRSVVRECEARHIPYYLYTFLHRGEEERDAFFLVQTCKPIVGPSFMGYVLDVEPNPKNNTTPTVEGVKQALNYISGQGKKCMIYTMHAQYSLYSGAIVSRPSNCAWWEARYGKNNGTDTSASYPCHNGVDLHQYTSAGKVEGISGSIDLNKLTGTKPLSWFTGSGEVKSASSSPSPQPSPKPSGNENVRKAQHFANVFVDAGIKEDGLLGPNTKKAMIKVLQKCLNIDYKKKLAIDGFPGKHTHDVLGHHYVKRGEKQYLVTFVECALSALGYDVHGIETPGIFGAGLEYAVKKVQERGRLNADGVAGYATLGYVISLLS